MLLCSSSAVARGLPLYWAGDRFQSLDFSLIDPLLILQQLDFLEIFCQYLKCNGAHDIREVIKKTGKKRSG